MPADPLVYDSQRLAQAYAHHRPAVHPQVLARAQALIGSGLPVELALDAGCGAGASTAALQTLAHRVVGLDPFAPMLDAARQCVPGAEFLQGRLEAIPGRDAVFDLVASAGAINYTEPRSALAELARVLKPGGWLVLYDFSDGRARHHPELGDALLKEMRKAYPSSGGYALDLAALPFADCGLTVMAHERPAVNLPMHAEEYLAYIMGDTGVERAIASGARESTVRHHLARLVQDAFGPEASPVHFDAELLLARRVAQHA